MNSHRPTALQPAQPVTAGTNQRPRVTGNADTATAVLNVQNTAGCPRDKSTRRNGFLEDFMNPQAKRGVTGIMTRELGICMTGAVCPDTPPTVP